MLAALSVSAGQDAELKLNDARTTYGVLGPARADQKLLTGDSLFVTFNIEGISTDEEGKVLYSIATEVGDAQGKVHFRQPARDLETINALGGGQLPTLRRTSALINQPGTTSSRLPSRTGPQGRPPTSRKISRSRPSRLA